MPDAPPPPLPADDGALTDLLAQCVLAYEERGQEAVDALIAARPALAVAAREQFRALLDAGLLVPPAAEPTAIGPYAIRRRLGTGGMGVVYLAEQKEPVRRDVAVKVIRPGMDSREVLARFAVERQALARIDHPNVAKIYDAGVTADNRPFLAMEYVDGLPLCAYCDERRLPLRARLELFARICDVVQHAHQKGILHRDLKPSNLLVAERDGAPWPMVIDFGVAKSIAGDRHVPGRTLLTGRGALLGTPEYMSPEQADGELDLDTRTDVYSLGVVLFELLTGTLPIESQRLRQRGGSELARVLRESEPPTASARISELGAAAATHAENRGTDATSLRRQVRGDLDWILRKALEKDRDRRYGVPAELAADLRRHLRQEPVLAGPPSAGYRLRKLVRRNRWTFAAIGVCTLSLVGGLVASLRFAQQAEDNATLARQHAATAAREAEHARASETEAAELAAEQKKIADRLSTSQQTTLDALDEMLRLGMNRLASVPQSEDLRRDLLQQVLVLHERLLTEQGEHDPRLHYSLARTLQHLASLQLSLGERARARETLERSRAEVGRLPADSAGVFEVRYLVASLDLAELEWHASGKDAAAARVAGERARSRARELLAEHPDHVPLRSLLMKALLELARLAQDVPTRRSLLLEAAPMAEVVLAQSQEPRLRMQALATLLDLATLHFEAGEREEGLRLAALAERAMGPDLAEDRPLLQRIELRGCLDQLAQLRFRNEDTAAARALLERSLAIQRQAVASFPSIDSLRNDLTATLGNLAVLQTRIGSRSEVVALQRELLEAWEALLARTPDDVVRRASTARAAAQLATTLVRWWRDLGVADAAGLGQATRLADELAATLPEAARADRNQRTQDLQVAAAVVLHRHLAGDASASRGFAEVRATGAALAAEFPQVEVLQGVVGDVATTEACVRLALGETADALAAAEAAVAAFDRIAQKNPAGQRRLWRDAVAVLARCRAAAGDGPGCAAALDRLAAAGTPDDHLALAAAIAALPAVPGDDTTLRVRGLTAAERAAAAFAAAPANDPLAPRRLRHARLLHLRFRCLAGDAAGAVDALDAAIATAAGDTDALQRAAEVAALAAGAGEPRAAALGVRALCELVAAGFPSPGLLRELPALRALRDAPGFTAALTAPR